MIIHVLEIDTFNGDNEIKHNRYPNITSCSIILLSASRKGRSTIALRLQEQLITKMATSKSGCFRLGSCFFPSFFSPNGTVAASLSPFFHFFFFGRLGFFVTFLVFRSTNRHHDNLSSPKVCLGVFRYASLLSNCCV